MVVNIDPAVHISTATWPTPMVITPQVIHTEIISNVFAYELQHGQNASMYHVRPMATYLWQNWIISCICSLVNINPTGLAGLVMRSALTLQP